MTQNGELLTDFCSANSLVIGGSMFPHKPCHKVTWMSPQINVETQIDHICISRKWRRSLLDVRNKRSADVASDHHLVIGVVRLRIARIQRPAERVGRRFDVSKLKSDGVKVAFVESVKQHHIPESINDIDSQWNTVKNAFITASEETLGDVPRHRKEWMSDELWAKIEERRLAKDRMMRQKLRSNTTTYSTLEREVKRLAKRDQQRWTNNMADQAQRAAGMNNMGLLYETTRKLSNCTRRSVPVKNKNGDILTNSADQLQRWLEYFNEVFRVP